ncbi:MAG: DUF3800 domain-containing protein [Ahrensia sp.]
MAKRHYTIYCDESAKNGTYFSNFYGGALVRSSEREAIEDILREKKAELNLNDEIKWTKITRNYESKYIEFIEFYFSFISSGRIKVRIMFTHNYKRPRQLTHDQRDSTYFLLYYQFLKHAFGLAYSNPNQIDRVFANLLLDQIPASRDKQLEFRSHVERIEQTHTYRGKNVFFQHGQIGGVDSKDHVILQGLDIILGSMYFRLNDLHLVKPEGSRFRGKRTIAKEKVYKEINHQIRLIYPNFNVGKTTGQANGLTDRWNHPYRHWCFEAVDSVVDDSAVKGKSPAGT